MRKLALRSGIATNSGFSGIYDFSGKTSYRLLFKKFISHGTDRVLVMYHPGYSDHQLEAIDSVTTQRENEFVYLESDDFLLDLDQSNFRFNGAERMKTKETVDPKAFWEDKILSWEQGRYQTTHTDKNLLERFANRASESLRFRQWVAGNILVKQVAGKRVLELGCGSGLLAQRLLSAGAHSYIGIDFSERAIENARARADEAGISDRVRFEAKSIKEMSEMQSDVVFSLGLLDWLSDDELDYIFKITAGTDYLHTISEKRASMANWIHRAYVQLAYGRQTGSYRPRYFSVAEIEEIARRHTNKSVRAFRERRLSFGTLVTTLNFDPKVAVNEPPTAVR
jgi:2-polyprenyl-3-methyl-5-hydroxy-6-metoxy-1,4-benzoquinol methylase